MADDADRWTARVKLVEARAAVAREVLEGRLDHLLPYISLFRSKTDVEWLIDGFVAAVGTLRRLVGRR